MMVPWDIYLPTPHAERYYGNASQYADLYKFVRENAELLDATTERIKIKDSTQVLTRCTECYISRLHYVALCLKACPLSSLASKVVETCGGYHRACRHRMS